MTKYWLMKSEPDAFSIDDLKALPNQTDMWDGVRNYQARNIMRDEMQQGDQVFFYHSNAKPPGIVAIAEIASEKSYPDPTQFLPESKYYDPKSDPEKPRWFLVDVKFVQDLNFVSLDELKANPKLKDMKVTQKGARLSVQPVSEAEWHEVLKMSELKN